jgi:hypothetical protein
MPGNEVGVEVGQENVSDRQLHPLRFLQVLTDVALRVHDHCRLVGFVAYQVRGMGKTAKIKLF